MLRCEAIVGWAGRKSEGDHYYSSVLVQGSIRAILCVSVISVVLQEPPSGLTGS